MPKGITLMMTSGWTYERSGIASSARDQQRARSRSCRAEPDRECLALLALLAVELVVDMPG